LFRSDTGSTQRGLNDYSYVLGQAHHDGFSILFLDYSFFVPAFFSFCWLSLVFADLF
jgi:hypothetical protein